MSANAQQQCMNIVLIPGAWMGAWVWEQVANDLELRGHVVHAITLPGLESADAPVADIGLKPHVDHVRSLLETNDLHDVVLVGHSYSGLVAGQVADGLQERVAHVVYVDAFLPFDGQSLLDTFPKEQLEDELQQIAENNERWPAPNFDGTSEQQLTPKQARWLVDRLIDQPGQTVSEPAVMSRSLADQSATYIVCTFEIDDDLAALQLEPTWTFKTLESGHWPMVSVPRELAALIAGAAAHP